MNKKLNKLGLDLGNSSMKIVGGEPDNLIYKRILSQATKHSQDSNYIVDLNGEIVYFGVGDPLIEQDKTNRKYLEHTLLLAAYEIYGPGEHQIELGLTLPINLYKLMGEYFKAKIEAIKELQGVVNGSNVYIDIQRVIVQPESLAAFYALMPEIQKEAILFVDLGHRTTDIVAINVNNETGRWKIEGSHTLQVGGYDFLCDLQGPLYMAEQTLFTPQQIEQRLSMGGQVGNTKIPSLYKAALTDRVNAMIKEMMQVFNDMNHRKIYLVGGAAEMFEACYEGDNLEVLQDKKMIYSNPLGSYLKL